MTFVSRGSPASDAGLVVSDVTNQIEKYEVADLGDFRDAWLGTPGKKSRPGTISLSAIDEMVKLYARSGDTAPISALAHKVELPDDLRAVWFVLW